MQRLSKFLASCGVSSRRNSEKLIEAGRVCVNNTKVLLPQTLVDETKDEIKLDEKILTKQKKVYFVLNKPKGVVCTSCKYSKKKRVIDLFDKNPRVFTVGRLDKNTTGLLIVTNDGTLYQKAIHPSSNLEREYLVETKKKISKTHIEKLLKGATIQNRFVKPKSLKLLKPNLIKVIVMEGKKREVRTFFKKANLKIKELQRIRLGFLKLKDLPIGSYRKMTKEEISKFLSL